MSDARPIPLDRLRDELAARYAPPARSRAALAKLRHAFRQLARAGVATTADLDAASVARLIATRPAGERRTTTRNLLAMVRVISTYAAEEGYCDGSPFYGRGPWVRRERRARPTTQPTTPPRTPAGAPSHPPTQRGRPPMMKLIFDGLFHFRGLHGVPSECHMLVYRGDGGAAVVVASEVKTNTGTSIANVPARLAAEVCRAQGLDPDGLIWVERFTDPPPRPGERLMILTFPDGWPTALRGKVARSPATAADIAKLVGRKELPAPPLPSY